MKRKFMFAPYITESTVKDLRVQDIMQMTHLNYSFAHVKDNIVTVDHLKYLDRLATYKAINPDLKIIISIGGWGADGFSQAAMTKEGLDSFSKTSMAIVEKWGFDGIDIDWEYPCSEQAGIAYSPKDKGNFTAMMQSLRDILDANEAKNNKKYNLSCAVGGGDYFVEGTEMEKVSSICDYINLMTYDLRGGFTNVSGHHTSLYPQTGDEKGICGTYTVDIFHKAGVPYEKMVLGAAFYGRQWTGIKSSENNGLMQEAASTGVGGGGFDTLKHDFIDKNGFTRYWDDQAKAPYLFNGDTFISYEDEESLKAKCEYVKKMNFYGIMYWAYGCADLFDVIAENLD